MLVLTRKPNKSIIIGTGPSKIVVKVLLVRGNQVSLGILAPPQVSILREEIADRNNGAVPSATTA